MSDRSTICGHFADRGQVRGAQEEEADRRKAQTLWKKSVAATPPNVSPEDRNPIGGLNFS